MSYASLVGGLREVFASGKTRKLQWRREQLQNILRMMKVEEKAICDAVYADLKKPTFEVSLTEILITKNECREALKNLSKWSRPEAADGNFLTMVGKPTTVLEPYGVTFLIGAWNYPIQLALVPVISAIAAGNCVLLKPSEHSEHTSRLLKTLFERYMDNDAVKVVEGGIPECTEILNERFDFIMYTGSPGGGKAIYQAAAKNLTPVLLELGGMNPVYVDEGCDLTLTAQRVAWGKFSNCGQICLAPNYILCSKAVQEKFVDEFIKVIKQWYPNPADSNCYARMINSNNFNRVVKMMDGSKEKIRYGGKSDAKDRFIEPTVLTDCVPTDSIMADEIFGPVLPIMPVSSLDEAIRHINGNEKPLSLYVFTKDDKVIRRFRTETSSGMFVVNDVMIQASVMGIPFGGVNTSGIGKYHGKYGFEAFSHRKGCLELPQAFENLNVVRYPPYSQQKMKIVNSLADFEMETSLPKFLSYPAMFMSFIVKLMGLKTPPPDGEKY